MSLLQKSPIKETIFCWNLRWSPSYQMVPSSPWISHVSYICVCVCGNELYCLFRVDTYYDPPIMRWLPLASSIKHRSLLQTSPTKETYILQKRPVILRSLPIVATPYETIAIYQVDLALLLNTQFLKNKKQTNSVSEHPVPYKTKLNMN